MWAAEAKGIEAFEKQLYLGVRSKARRGCENSFVGGGGRGSRGMRGGRAGHSPPSLFCLLGPFRLPYGLMAACVSSPEFYPQNFPFSAL